MIFKRIFAEVCEIIAIFAGTYDFWREKEKEKEHKKEMIDDFH